MPRSGDGPRAESQAVTILSVPAAEPVVVCFAGPIVGLITHHHSGRSYGCPGEEDCPSTLHRSRTLWKGYAPCRTWAVRLERWCPAVLEVTECLEETLRGRHLAGEVWMLTREGARRRSGKVLGAYLERKRDEELLEPFDVRQPLYRLYHTLELRLGVANPLPAKLVLPAISAAGPTLPTAARPADIPSVTEAQREALRKLASRGTAASANGQPTK